ncbi:LysR family transcriptional regulator [Parasphingopyxis sp.]|uniref:LysR family transcriptional regulator n=1 Tax=Parasphingopyxis sp. TaxID=1920299 RepID=UPI0026290424|nr:LysR family transcriptional regulator [Parasphingopyxis sp.]
MELKWLEDFICAAEKGHFARAADHRFVTPSALSRRIQSLELWIGAPLFDRAVHPITLTAAGEDLMETVVAGDPSDQRLILVSDDFSTHLAARIYRSADNSSSLVSNIWQDLETSYPPTALSDL